MPKNIPQLLVAVWIGLCLTFILHWASRQPTYGVMRDTSQPVETLNHCLIGLAGLGAALTYLSLTPSRALRLLAWAITYSTTLPVIILLSPHWIANYRCSWDFSAHFSAEIFLGMSISVFLSRFPQGLLTRLHCQQTIDAWLATKKHWRHTIVAGFAIWFCLAVIVLYSQAERPSSLPVQFVLSMIVFTQVGATVAAYSLAVAIPWLILAAYFCVSYTASKHAVPKPQWIRNS